MYRTHMNMENQENLNNQQEGEMESVITRMSHLPIVHSAVDQVQNVYSKAKESHPYVKSTLEVAEKTVAVAAETAKPYVDKLEGPLSTANTYANKGLDKLEEKVPVITKPTDEVYEATMKPGIDYVKNVAGYGKDTLNAGIQKINDTKDVGVQKVVDTANLGKSKVTDAKDYTLEHVNAALQTSYGQALIKGVDNVLAKTEEYVDYYLPPATEDGKNEMNGSDERSDEGVVSEQQEGVPAGVEYDQVKRIGELSSKVRKRMYVHALKQMRNLQLRSRQTLESLHFTVDLIEYAQSNIDNANQKVKGGVQVAQQKLVDTWTQLNSDQSLEGGEGAERPEQLSEQQTLVVARNLTRLLSTAYHSAYSASYALLPAALQRSLHSGREQVDDLYRAFNQTTHFEDLSVTWLQQSREKLGVVQTELQRVAEAVLNSKALSWLVPEFDVSDVDLQGEIFGDSDGNSLNLSVDEELRVQEMIQQQQRQEDAARRRNDSGGEGEGHANNPGGGEGENYVHNDQQ